MEPAVKIHMLNRPSWLCDCGKEWPCAAKRARFRTDYARNPDGLRQFMERALTEAISDMPDADPDELRRRFVGWLPGVRP